MANERMRYRLQRKERKDRRYVIGNRLYPYPAYQWTDIALSNDKEALRKVVINQKDDYRIEDTINGYFETVI
jgi:hypothetical protein